jgi:hypothetical protein
MAKQQNNESSLTKKVWTLAGVIAVAGVGFVIKENIIQLK